MKAPKPHARSPQLWGAWDEMDKGCFDKLRILYPCGKTEWVYTDISIFRDNAHMFGKPCWQKVDTMKSFKKRIKLMKKYDKKMGAKTVFMGNI